MTIQYQVSLREMSENFAHYIKDIEAGNEIIITRHDIPIARMTRFSLKKTLSAEQLQARSRVLEMMRQGLSLKGKPFNREEIHER